MKFNDLVNEVVELEGKKHQVTIADAREIVSYVLRRLNKLTLLEIVLLVKKYK